MHYPNHGRRDSVSSSSPSTYKHHQHSSVCYSGSNHFLRSACFHHFARTNPTVNANTLVVKTVVIVLQSKIMISVGTINVSTPKVPIAILSQMPLFWYSRRVSARISIVIGKRDQSENSLNKEADMVLIIALLSKSGLFLEAHLRIASVRL